MPPAFEVLLLNTTIPQIQAAQSGDTYLCPRELAVVVNSATDAVRITQTGAGNALLVEDSANPDSTPFVVTAAGDVGIGTSSPTYKLDVTGAMRSSAQGFWNTSYTNTTAGTFYTDNTSAGAILLVRRGRDIGAGAVDAVGLDCLDGAVANGVPLALRSTTMNLIVSGANYFAVSTNGSERARISSDGTFRVKGAGTAGSTDAFQISGSAPADAARLTSGGDFLVGQQTVSTTALGAALQRTQGANKWALNIAGAASTSADYAHYVYSTTASAYRFLVDYAGTIFATSTTISAISDQRFKENIRDLDDGINVVMALKPRKFDWKDGKGKDVKNDRGFIAQEFEQILPELVDKWADPAPEGEEPYKSVRQDLIPVLVKAIQEQQAMINELKAKVASLGA